MGVTVHTLLTFEEFEKLPDQYLFTVLATNRVRLCPGDDAKA